LWQHHCFDDDDDDDDNATAKVGQDAEVHMNVVVDMLTWGSGLGYRPIRKGFAKNQSCYTRRF
jgi:hypothetical protein